jgi:hypothetical protein
MSVIHSPSSTISSRANPRPAVHSYEVILIVGGRPERKVVRDTAPHALILACRQAVRDLGAGCLLAYDMATGALVFEA